MAPPLVPEIRLHRATEVLPMWRLREEELQQQGVPPPYWAFAWAGGQALARYVLDHPDSVDGAVLDFGSGSGLVAIAAAMAGATSVLAADIDRYATAAIALNAQANGLEIDTTSDDLIGGFCGWGTILGGGMCYQRPPAARLPCWRKGAAAGRAPPLPGEPRPSGA